MRSVLVYLLVVAVQVQIQAEVHAQIKAEDFANFESPQSHSLRLSVDGHRLFAVHTADNRLAVFTLQDPRAPTLVAEVPVGLEPVALAVRSADEVWVVNRLSDSISVVSLSKMAVVDTLRVGDEPADVVFAGKPLRAFVSIAGTNQVQILDPTTRKLVKTLDVFGKEPRSLTVSSDGSRVFLAILHSGNRTTILPRKYAPPQPKPTNPQLFDGPSVTKIISSEDPKWKSKVNVDLPDNDVFEIDANKLTVVTAYHGVGTTLFDVAVRPGTTPGTSEVWVANTEARNLVQLEPALRGHVVDNRVTRITTGQAATVQPFDLNPNVDYKTLPNQAALGTALAQPVALVFDPKGTRLYVAAFGTDRIGVLDAAGKVLARIEVGGTPGTKIDPRRKRGPRALAHHPTRELLFVLNRLSASLAVVDTRAQKLVREVSIGYDPTPKVIREGRGFLYDAKLSGNGTMSCASCHVDADHDHLAWDLGDPAGTAREVNAPPSVSFVIHPMKGPMTTQTLAGLAGVAPYHWRGDRASLHDFNPAFGTLLGGKPLSQRDMDDHVAFLESIRFAPNPNQNLDRTYPTTPKGESAQEGFEFFRKTDFGGIGNEKTCVECHELPSGSTPDIHQGRNAVQYFKVPHLRSVYKRLDRIPSNGKRMGGFGLLHAGDGDDVVQLFQSAEFFGKLATQPARQRMLQRFVLAFDTGTAPAVGYSRTVRKDNVATQAVKDDLLLLMGQAAKGNCDLVAKGLFRDEPRGFWYDPVRNVFVSDRAADKPFALTDLHRELAAGGALLTFLGVPPETGVRIGIDRDLDGVLDGDEGAVRYGSAHGCTGRLELSVNTPPQKGNRQFAFVCTKVPPHSVGLLAIAARPATVVVSSLVLWVDPQTAVLFLMPADPAGAGILSMPVPDDAALVGRAVYAQGFFATGCGAAGISASLGLKAAVSR
ncbi:MAG: beta-propeller fold lactonase family protein [Planctomycetota bacterium]|jgi:DNA-binding beta-propeller fold protein YncE